MDGLDNTKPQLAPSGLLQALTSEQFDGLMRKSQRRELKAGETVINQGDEEGNFAVYLLSGGLKVSFVSAGGREIILSYCSPGEVVGEIALLDSGPRTATVSASSASVVYIIPDKAFLDTVSSNPGTAVDVMRELARRIRQLNLVIESDRTFSMGPRLARALVRLIDQNGGDGALLHNPSQSDLGAFAGLARENVSRLLSEWEEQGIIARKGRSLIVRNAEYLQSLAEFGDAA